MSEITSILPHKKIKDRFKVYIDNQFAFSVSSDFLVDNNLQIGRTISIDEFRRLSSLVDFDRIFTRLLNFVSYRPRSKKEVLGFLSKYSLSRSQQEKMLSKLESYGLLNDFEFAKWWVESRLRSSPKGKIVLRLELIRKGLSKEIIDNVLLELDDDIEKELVLKFVERLSEKYKNLEKIIAINKIKTRLLRRGFQLDIINEILDAFYN